MSLAIILEYKHYKFWLALLTCISKPAVRQICGLCGLKKEALWRTKWILEKSSFLDMWIKSIKWKTFQHFKKHSLLYTLLDNENGVKSLTIFRCLMKLIIISSSLVLDYMKKVHVLCYRDEPPTWDTQNSGTIFNTSNCARKKKDMVTHNTLKNTLQNLV